MTPTDLVVAGVRPARAARTPAVMIYLRLGAHNGKDAGKDADVTPHTGLVIALTNGAEHDGAEHDGSHSERPLSGDAPVRPERPGLDARRRLLECPCVYVGGRDREQGRHQLDEDLAEHFAVDA